MGTTGSAVGRQGKERATTNQPIGLKMSRDHTRLDISFRFQISQSVLISSKRPASSSQSCQATARLRKTLDFLSTIFQTPIEIRAHRRRMIGKGGAGGTVRVSEALSSLG